MLFTVSGISGATRFYIQKENDLYESAKPDCSIGKHPMDAALFVCIKVDRESSSNTNNELLMKLQSLLPGNPVK